jgi:hypothetical protein
MPTVKAVERQIKRCEGFRVQFRNKDTWRDINGNLDGIPSYKYAKMAKNKWSITRWTEQRFNISYPGFDVAVLKANGHIGHGRTHLATVRDTYLED